jgi:OOP family OmpA-OmpF porin
LAWQEGLLGFARELHPREYLLKHVRKQTGWQLLQPLGECLFRPGLLLRHVVAAAVPTQDVEVIPGMLTAMQDFVRDSFGIQQEETLEALRVGDVTIWVEQGPKALIATVIRGNAPAKLRSLLQDALETIHLEQEETLDTFQGDAAPFPASRSYLATCLQAQYVAPPSQPSFFLGIGLIVILSAIGLWGYGVIRDNRHWTVYL